MDQNHQCAQLVFLIFLFFVQDLVVAAWQQKPDPAEK